MLIYDQLRLNHRSYRDVRHFGRARGRLSVDKDRRHNLGLKQEIWSKRFSLHLIDPLLHFARRSPKINAEDADAMFIDLAAQTVGDRLEGMLRGILLCCRWLCC